MNESEIQEKLSLSRLVRALNMEIEKLIATIDGTVIEETKEDSNSPALEQRIEYVGKSLEIGIAKIENLSARMRGVMREM